MDKSWDYVKKGKDKLRPIPESELRNLIERSHVLGSDLAWSENMPDREKGTATERQRP